MKSGKKSLWAHGIHWGNSSGSTSKPPYLYLQWIISTLHHHLCRQLVMNFWKVLFQMLESEIIKLLTDTSSLNFVATSKHPIQILQGTCTCSFPSPSNRSFVEFDLITGPWPEGDSPREYRTALRIPAKSTFRLLPFTGILLDKKSNRSDLRISSQTPEMLGRNSWQGIASVLEVRSKIYWIKLFAWVNSVLDFCEETSTNFFIENFGNVPEGVGQERERERKSASQLCGDWPLINILEICPHDPHVNEQTFVALTRMFARTWNCLFLARFKSHCKGNCQVPGALTTPRKRYHQSAQEVRC